MKSWISGVMALACVVIRATAAISGPYAADADTVHLYHLDESAGTSISANTGTAGRTVRAVDQSAGITTPPAVNTILGATGYSGFGKAATLTTAGYMLGFDLVGTSGYRGDSGSTLSSDRILLNSLGIDGAAPFTLEALVNPSGSTGAREIISTDSSDNTRGFQFRIITGGTTGQQLEFNLIGVASSQRFGSIPNAGAHAFATGTWFHVAFTFDGTHARFYWTKLDPGVGQANLLGSPQTLALTGSGTIAGPLVLGNENRAAASEVLNGLLDEVRISKVARSAADFMFLPGADDSDEDGLPDTWEVAIFGGITSQSGADDFDGDFATNSLELAASTHAADPLAWPDTDSDGLNDGWEQHYFSGLGQNAGGDPDSDSATNLQEQTANSDPTHPAWTPSAAVLAHRWTFNGTLADSVGSSNAVVIDPDSNAGVGGTSTLSATDLLLGGGARSTSAYVQLGSGLLSDRKTPVTLELWATQVSVQNWSRVFDIGSGIADNLFMTWTQGTTLAADRVTWADATTNTVDNSSAPFTLGTKHHLVMTIEPLKGAGGTTRVTWYAASAASPVLGSAQGTFDTSNLLLDLNDTAFWLGRSQFTADNTANARYDEVRIWNGALGSSEREGFHQFGPDYPSFADGDGDGLPDGWEMARFGNLAQTATGDSDSDGFTHLQEYQGGSNPGAASSVPGDTDGDSLADPWELAAFGNLDQAASGDPDGDGEVNGTEESNGSSPINRGSTATDIDADALPDSWELQSFGALTGNGGTDADGDGFGNLQEQLAGTSPVSAASRPAGTAVKLVPVDDGDNATSEFGYAGSSAINSVAFVRSSLKTVGNQQFMTWYGRHQYDSSALYNNTIWIGRRTLGSSQWEVFRHPTFTANAITDGHDVISYGIDGDGYMHLSWGMHGDAFHYAKSLSPVTGTEPIALGPDTTMSGREDTVTYPQFLKLPDGDLLFIFREVASGSGDTYISRYDTASKSWDNVHRSGATQLPFIKGTGWSPDYNAYLNMPQLGGDGDDLILTWCWRYEPVGGDSPGGFDGYQTNNHLNYARSTDAGVTWQKFDGTAYALPISRNGESGVAATTAERILTIPEGSSLINQASTCLDQAGNPVTATWWAPDTASVNYRRQYMVVFRHDNGTWQQRPVSNRVTDPTGTRYAESHVRDLGRPIVVNDDDDRIIVAYRDNQASNLSNVDNSLNTGVANGLTIVHSLPKSEDPDRMVWIEFNLTSENLGNYEPIIDNELWDRERQLHFLYQPSGGQGYTAPANTASRISVLEWDARRYFRHNPQPGVTFNADGTQVTLTCPTEPSYGYKLFSSTNLQDWQLVQSYAGNGAPWTITQPVVNGEGKKFWKIQFIEGGY